MGSMGFWVWSDDKKKTKKNLKNLKTDTKLKIKSILFWAIVKLYKLQNKKMDIFITKYPISICI